MHKPASGDILHLTKAASVQFSGDRDIFFRVIRIHDWPTYHGWCWLDGYELEKRTGEAIERRSVFVQTIGLRRLNPPQQKADKRGKLVKEVVVPSAEPAPPPVAAKEPAHRPVSLSEYRLPDGEFELQEVIVQSQGVAGPTVRRESVDRVTSPGSLGEVQPRMFP